MSPSPIRWRPLLAALGTVTLTASTLTPTASALLFANMTGTGWIDIVGQESTGTTATWSVSARNPQSQSIPFDRDSGMRIVLPGTVEKPTVSNLTEAPAQCDDDIDALASYSAVQEALYDVSTADADTKKQAYTAITTALLERPELMANPGWTTLASRMSDAVDASYRYDVAALNPDDGSRVWDTLGGMWLSESPDAQWALLRDSAGNYVMPLGAIRDVSSNTTTMSYLTIDESFVESMTNSPSHEKYSANGGRGLAAARANANRTIYTTTFEGPLAYNATIPAGTASNTSTVAASDEFVTVVGRTIGALTNEATAMMPNNVDAAIFGNNSAARSGCLKEASAPDIEFKKLTDTDNNTWWVAEFMSYAPEMHFNVTAEITKSTDNAPVIVPAQAYLSSACSRAGKDDDWSCERLTSYDWGRGANTPQTDKSPDAPGARQEDGARITRGELKLTGLTEDTRAGVFGNPYCMVTRNISDELTVAKGVPPTDFNTLLSGEPSNSISPSQPQYVGSYSAEIELSGDVMNQPFEPDDACDQAAAVVRTSPTPPTTTTPPPAGDDDTDGGTGDGGDQGGNGDTGDGEVTTPSDAPQAEGSSFTPLLALIPVIAIIAAIPALAPALSSPAQTAAVVVPPAEAPVQRDHASAPPRTVLAVTGADTAGWGIAGVLTVFAGLMLLAAVRRRSN